MQEAHPELEITTEYLFVTQVYVARGRNGANPWVLLSSSLERFERALTP